MLRRQLTGSALGILVLLVLVPSDIEAGNQIISIVLKPRDYVDHRLNEDFICGVNKAKKGLLAEQNTNFIFDFVNTGKQPRGYRTEVYDVVTFTKDGQVMNMLSEMPDDLHHMTSGLFTLFVAPLRAQCNSRTFSDIEETGSRYYPIYVGVSSDFTEQTNKFISDVSKFKKIYNDEFLKLCAAVLPILTKSQTRTSTPQTTTTTTTATPTETTEITIAFSKANILTGLYDFLYNSDNREFEPSKENECRNKEESIEAFKKVDFINTEPKMTFEEKTVIASELDGFSAVKIQRESTSGKAVGFVRTSFPDNGGQLKPADETDIVTYEGPVLFMDGEQVTHIYITIKQDEEAEVEEAVIVEIVSSRTRKKRHSLSCIIHLFDKGVQQNQVIPDQLKNCQSWMNFQILSNLLKDGHKKTEEEKVVVLEEMTEHIMSLTRSFAEADKPTDQFQMFRRMCLSEYYNIYVKKVEGGAEWNPKREIWFSTSIKHPRLFVNYGNKQRDYDVVMVFHLNIDKFETNFKNRIIHQQDAAAFNKGDTKIEDLKNYVHRELLEIDREPMNKKKKSINHPWTKYNFALLGQKNAELFNECIVRVEVCEIESDPKGGDKFIGDKVKKCRDTKFGVGLGHGQSKLKHFREGEGDDDEERSVSSKLIRETNKKYDKECKEIKPKPQKLQKTGGMVSKDDEDGQSFGEFDWNLDAMFS